MTGVFYMAIISTTQLSPHMAAKYRVLAIGRWWRMSAAIRRETNEMASEESDMPPAIVRHARLATKEAEQSICVVTRQMRPGCNRFEGRMMGGRLGIDVDYFEP